MPAPNGIPRYTKVANIGHALVNAANTKSDGTGDLTTGPTMYLLLTAGAAGSYVGYVRVLLVGSTAGTATNATVIRVYVSTVGTGPTTNANTHLLAEINVPAGTADQAAAANSPIEVAIAKDIPAGSFILASSHAAAAANTGFQVGAFGGDY